MSKNLITVSLSTAMGLGVIGSVAGTVAWYQYNTRATTTVISTNVANSGVLQISTDGTNWTRDLITRDLLGSREDAKVTPVTFGALNADGSLKAKAYKRPEASANGFATNPGSYAEVYEEASADKDYIQYTMYLRAQSVADDASGMKKEKLPVFLSDIRIEDLDAGIIAKGLRIHLSVDDEGDGTVDRNILLSKNAVDGEALFGALDVDGNEKVDIVGGYEDHANRFDAVVYGNDGEYQDTVGADELEAGRDAEGNILSNQNVDKIVAYTSEEATDTKIVVTLWVEGWDRTVGTVDATSNRLVFGNVDELALGQNLDGLDVYKLDGTNYVKATGRAEASTNYFKVYYEKIELADNDPVPASTAEIKVKKLEGSAYVDNTDSYAQTGAQYFREYVKDVTTSIRTPDNTLTGIYHKSGNDYISGALQTTGNYQMLNKDVVWTEVNMKDADDNEKPAGTVDVSDYYTKDASDNYIKASGKNVSGVKYYSLASNVKNLPIWSGQNTFDAGFLFGLTFDVGRNAFDK